MRRWGPSGPPEVMPALSHGWWKGWRGPKPLTADFHDRGGGFNILSGLMARLPTAAGFACAGCLFGAAWAGSADVRLRVFVLEAEPPGVAALALDTGESLARLALGRPPDRMFLSPANSRLVVLDRGPGKETVRFGYHPTGKSWVTVIDPASLQEVGRSELCWNVVLAWRDGVDVSDPGVFGADGRRLTLPCAGYRSQKPEEALPRELVNVDLDTGRVTGRLELARAIDSLVALPGADNAVVYSAREAPKNLPALPAELRFVNLANLEVEQTVTVEGQPGPPTLSPDGEYLYLLENGRPDWRPEKDIGGRVHVVSVARRAHEANLEAGSAPRGLVVDKQGRQVFLLSEKGSFSVEKKYVRRGELRVIRGAAVAATVEVGDAPLFLRVPPDRANLYVVSFTAITIVDLAALSRGDSAISAATISLATDDDWKKVKELALSSNGKRGYVLYEGSSKLGVVDLEHRKLITEVKTGRGGVRFGKAFGEVALYFSGMMLPLGSYDSSLALSADEKFVYALNARSNDVTIVNTETREVVDKIAVGGAAKRLELLPGGSFVAVTTGADTLHLIDTRTNAKVSERPDGGNYLHSPDKRHAAAIGKGVVYCLDGASLKTLGQATGFTKPVQLLFEPLAGPLPAPEGTRPERPPSRPCS